ncbi:MAG: LURP-one-related family protein [Ilumatobacteraceae bacterium]|jgi:uncharacterized protein YxjI
MGLLRHHHDEHERYRMQTDLLSIGDDYWIENSDGDRAYKVNGKVARLRNEWVLEDRHRERVAVIREHKLSVRDEIKIDLGGRTAKVKKSLVGLRDRFHIDVEHGDDMKAHGNILDHEYEIECDGDRVAQVSKKWFRVRDSYGIEIYDTSSVPLILAIAVAVEELARDH